MTEWYTEWFNEDYLIHYKHRDDASARTEVAALLDLLQLPKSASILDLCCGTGRHAAAIAEAGYTVTGVDLSETLLEKARARNTPVRFVQRDMRNLHDIGIFDAIFNFFTSFGYLGDEDQLVFDQVAAVLKRGGVFFLDFLHPDEIRRTAKAKIEGDYVVKTIEFPHKTYQERVRLYSRDEIETMLGRAGLAVIDVYNDYDWTPWREDGDRQLFVCERS